MYGARALGLGNDQEPPGAKEGPADGRVLPSRRSHSLPVHFEPSAAQKRGPKVFAAVVLLDSYRMGDGLGGEVAYGA